MNKKVIALIVGLIAVAGIAVGLMVFNTSKDENIDMDTNLDSSQIADELDPYLEDKTKEEIEDTLGDKLTEAQQHAFEDALANMQLPEDTKVDEEGNLYVTDEDGIDKEIEHPHQDIMEMTDEEAQREADRIKQELANQMGGNPDDGAGDDAGSSGNNYVPDNQTGNNETGNNSSSGGQVSTGEVWDQEFYESLTDEQKQSYENGNDEYRKRMQKNLEVARQWEEQGYEPITGN